MITTALDKVVSAPAAATPRTCVTTGLRAMATPNTVTQLSAAVEKLRQVRVDVVVLDLRLPDCSGIDSVKAVKAAADIYMPVEGEIVEVNEALRNDPALVNRDPMGDGWFFKVHVTHMEQFDELMDPPAYDKLLKAL